MKPRTFNTQYDPSTKFYQDDLELKLSDFILALSETIGPKQYNSSGLCRGINTVNGINSISGDDGYQKCQERIQFILETPVEEIKNSAYVLRSYKSNYDELTSIGSKEPKAALQKENSKLSEIKSQSQSGFFLNFLNKEKEETLSRIKLIQMNNELYELEKKIITARKEVYFLEQNPPEKGLNTLEIAKNILNKLENTKRQYRQERNKLAHDHILKFKLTEAKISLQKAQEIYTYTNQILVAYNNAFSTFGSGDDIYESSNQQDYITTQKMIGDETNEFDETADIAFNFTVKELEKIIKDNLIQPGDVVFITNLSHMISLKRKTDGSYIIFNPVAVNIPNDPATLANELRFQTSTLQKDFGTATLHLKVVSPKIYKRKKINTSNLISNILEKRRNLDELINIDSEDLEKLKYTTVQSLFILSIAGHIEGLKELIKFIISHKKLNLDEILSTKNERNGYTALHYAVHFGHTEVIKFLIQQKTDKEAKSKSGRSPLQIAVVSGQAGSLNTLISNGTIIHDGYQLAKTAAQFGFLNIIKSLAQNKIAVNEIEEKSAELAKIAKQNGHSHIRSDTILKACKPDSSYKFGEEAQSDLFQGMEIMEDKPTDAFDFLSDIDFETPAPETKKDKNPWMKLELITFKHVIPAQAGIFIY